MPSPPPGVMGNGGPASPRDRSDDTASVESERPAAGVEGTTGPTNPGLPARNQDRVLGELVGLATVQQRMEAKLEDIQQQMRSIAAQLTSQQPAQTVYRISTGRISTSAVADLADASRSQRHLAEPPSSTAGMGRPSVNLRNDCVAEKSESSNVQVFRSNGTNENSEAASADSGPGTFVVMENAIETVDPSVDWPASVHFRHGLMRISERPSLPVSTVVLMPSQGTGYTTGTLTERANRWTVHPNSTFHLVYSQLLIVVLCHDLTVVPLILAWDLEVEGWLLKASWVACCFWTVDLVMNFLTGFYVGGSLERACSPVALRYLKSWFMLDFMIVTCDWMSLVMLASPVMTQGMLRILKTGKVLRIAGLFRLSKVTAILSNIMDRSLLETGRLWRKCFMLIIGTLLLNHLMSCTWFAIGRLARADTGMRWVDQSREMGGVSIEFLSTDGFYQWTTAMHWSMAQITLGSIEFTSYNSAERLFAIASMAIGLFYSSTLVSSLSATMVEYQMFETDKNEKLKRLRRFLLQKRIPQNTARLAIQQASERLNVSEDIREEDVKVLPLLSNALRTQVRYELFQGHLKSHPFFNLWAHFHPPTIQGLCMEAVQTIHVRPQDDLFRTGTITGRAYYFSVGHMKYRPDFAADCEVVINEPCWMSEASLWTHWTHVGTAKATTKCEVSSVSADALIRVLGRTRVLSDMTRAYGLAYHRCVISAGPPRSEWPSDVAVPGTNFADLVLAMEHNMQEKVSMETIERAKLTHWSLPSLSNSAIRRLHNEITKGDLLNEIRTGTCCVIMNADRAERLVGQVMLRLTDQQGRIFVELCSAQNDDKKPALELPSVELVRAELPERSVARLLGHVPIPESKVYHLSTNRVEQVKSLRAYGMPTRFVKYIHYMNLREELGLPKVVLPTAQEIAFDCKQSSISTVSEGLAARRSSIAGDGLAARRSSIAGLMGKRVQVDSDLYVGRKKNIFYTWLSPDQFEHLCSPAGRHELLSWAQQLKSINVDRPTVQHMVSIDEDQNTS